MPSSTVGKMCSTDSSLLMVMSFSTWSCRPVSTSRPPVELQRRLAIRMLLRPDESVYFTFCRSRMSGGSKNYDAKGEGRKKLEIAERPNFKIFSSSYLLKRLVGPSAGALGPANVSVAQVLSQSAWLARSAGAGSMYLAAAK
uniref:Uncharacterized protein n=1 Tax=Tanacetum cinerariifolium TaxID=118510 RepID=A0A699SQZ2_TANCI|nr:hypothetical protein [Tanacetum cinerariifolium]